MCGSVYCLVYGLYPRLYCSLSKNLFKSTTQHNRAQDVWQIVHVHCCAERSRFSHFPRTIDNIANFSTELVVENVDCFAPTKSVYIYIYILLIKQENVINVISVR